MRHFSTCAARRGAHASIRARAIGPVAAGARRQAADSSRSTVRVAWNRGALATLASMARHLFLWSGS
jgi:hypothetical protein